MVQRVRIQIGETSMGKVRSKGIEIGMGLSPKRPRLVTFPRLVVVLLTNYPSLKSWPWAVNAIRDLWLLGAPIPQDRCPGNKPCEAYPVCNHIRRVLLPNVFEKWWDEVRTRQSLEIAAETVLQKFD